MLPAKVDTEYFDLMRQKDNNFVLKERGIWALTCYHRNRISNQVMSDVRRFITLKVSNYFLSSLRGEHNFLQHQNVCQQMTLQSISSAYQDS